jgi:hypothetical protein
MTNLHNIKNNASNFSKSLQKFGKITIHTNNTNYIKNAINNMNIDYGTTKIRKDRKKNNIFYSKNILSGERGRSSSSIQKRPKKVFSSILQYNSSNINLLSLKNSIGSNKNSDNINVISPISKEKKIDIIPPIKKNDNIIYKDHYRGLKIKDFKLKGRHLNLHKILNIAQSNKRTKSTGK